MCRSSGVTSSTHYPSWGSITVSADALTSAADSSLPLMGIDNTGHSSICRETGCDSLPLMGIDNGHTFLVSAYSHGHSLPLMGIDNAKIAASAVHTGDSLPLMGIDNLGNRDRWGRDTSKTHYPSWGSITSGSEPCRSRYAGAHYPSWGSITCLLPTGRA